MSSDNEKPEVTISQKELGVLVTSIIPTSKYFEVRFDHMQEQITDLKDGQEKICDLMDKRFEQVGKQFQQVDENQKVFRQDMDRRFEEARQSVEKRFEQVDKRFEQVNVKLDALLDRIDVKLDHGLTENRSLTVRLFSFAMMFSAISMVGLIGKVMGVF